MGFLRPLPQPLGHVVRDGGLRQPDEGEGVPPPQLANGAPSRLLRRLSAPGERVRERREYDRRAGAREPAGIFAWVCGIVGYVGRRPAQALLLAGLGKLEYR